MSISRLFRTVRHLRPIQVWGRIRFWSTRPKPDLSAPPSLATVKNEWCIPASRKPTLVGPDKFNFMFVEGCLAIDGWEDPRKSRLWLYNLHYFDDLNAESASHRQAWHQDIIERWIRENPPGSGTGWEPYPTSLRIVNWVKWALAGNTLSNAALASLATQTRWLTQRLEWHLLGNHIFANAKALIFAGLFFTGSEARAWLAKGLSILERELPEQILPDGAQFELSPMYHALAVEDLLDLINVAKTFAREDLTFEWCRRIPDMLVWLHAMSHPDGGISFFNDAAFDVAPDNSEILCYAQRLGLNPGVQTGSLCHLKDSGYVRMAAGDFLVIADLAPIGPDYLPGHAHADTLSFEMSFGRQRVFVNSGTSEYGIGAERQRQRGTAAHNTVVVNGKDSSEVWAGFRVGRRARTKNITVVDHNLKLLAAASHDGYSHLKGSPVVRREFALNDEMLIVEDEVFPIVDAEARYHLHPMIEVRDLSAEGALLVLPNGRILHLQYNGVALRVEPATWHPKFGLKLPSKCLVLPLTDGRARLTVRL